MNLPNVSALVPVEDVPEPARVLRVESIPDPFHIEPPSFLVGGLILEDTYGEMAGAEKALKSTTALAIAIGGGLGVDVLGKFPTPRAFSSVIFSGEGGRNLFLRRYERNAHAYGATVDDLRTMVRYSVESAPVTSSAFRDAIQAELDTHQPALVVIDPWYSYASTETDARDLYQTGAVLNGLRELVCQDGTSLLIVNHFNQTGNGNGLKRITMAGHAEWCDSWWLLNHRTPPNVEDGRFALTMDIGSRQWGGRTWDLDYDLGRFDDDLGAHVGQMTWDVRRGGGVTSDRAKPNELAAVLELIPKATNAVKNYSGAAIPRGKLETLLPGKARNLRRDAIDAAALLGCIAEESGERGARIYRYVRKFTHDDADRWRELCGVNE